LPKHNKRNSRTPVDSFVFSIGGDLIDLIDGLLEWLAWGMAETAGVFQQTDNGATNQGMNVPLSQHNPVSNPGQSTQN